MESKIKKAAEYLKQNCAYRPKIGVILGSGLGSYGDSLKNAKTISYQDIPNFPVSTVEGHAGKFIITEQVICMQGRFHYYEGYDMEQVTFPIRVMKLLGVENLIVTNAAGGVNQSFGCGDLMLITDHINMLGKNPLIGKNIDSFGIRFPDMSEAYAKDLIAAAKNVAQKINLPLKEGIYMYPLHSMRDYFSVVSGMVFGSIILKDCIGARGMHLNRRTSGRLNKKRI